MDRQELPDREAEAWPMLVGAFTAFPVEEREVEGVVPGWSVHDVVYHCGYWASYSGDVLERMLAGDADPEDRSLPNDEVLVLGRGVSWDEAVRYAEQGRVRARAAFASLSEPTALAIEYFTDEALEHFEEHGAEIRAFMA